MSSITFSLSHVTLETYDEGVALACINSELVDGQRLVVGSINLNDVQTVPIDAKCEE